MSKAIEKLQDFFLEQGILDELDEEVLGDLVQDIVNAEMLSASGRNGDASGGLDNDPGAWDGSVDEADGVLVVRFLASGGLQCQVRKYGTMSEAKLEANLMTVYRAIQTARAVEYHKQQATQPGQNEV